MRSEFIIYHYQHKGYQSIIDTAIVLTLGTLLSRSYSSPNEPIIEKEASNPSKVLTREHEGS